MPLPITRQRRLFCLLVCHGTPSYYGVVVFSLSIPHGMHLVAPTQLCPFRWYVIPARHFPQKSLGRNLKIGFPLSPPPNHAILPLTHDLTTSCIGWVQAGVAWALRVPFFHMSKICLSLTHPPWSEGFPAQFAIYFLTFYVSCFLISRSL